MAEKINLPPIDQGAAFKHSFFWFDIPDPINNPDFKVPLPLTGYEGRLQLRSELGNPDPSTLLADWSTANGILVFDANEVRIFVPASATLTYSFDEAYYDLILWPTANPEDVTRLVQGEVPLSKGCSVRG